MHQIGTALHIAEVSTEALSDGRLAGAYRAYVALRGRSLLGRQDKHPEFPGVHTGYHPITGVEFSSEDVVSYGWINGRGACVFSRLARHSPAESPRLRKCAARAVDWIDRYADGGHGRVPFTASADGSKVVLPCPDHPDYRTYSDLHSCAGLLEYGVTFKDPARVSTARRVLEESLKALADNRIVDEPWPGPEGAVPENPWSWALDLSNEFVKQLREPSYLDAGAKVLRHMLDTYYLPDAGALIEYVTPEGRPLTDAQGRMVVDPGHSIEFCSFALEFSRLAEQAGRHEALRAEVNRVCPPLMLWNLDRGWNPKHPGIIKTFDLYTGALINGSMPWWPLPEAMLASLLAFERTRDSQFLKWYKKINNDYFGNYLNPKTDYGPYQTLDGETGLPLDLVPACKFQDPEFHSGKNLLTCVDVLERIKPLLCSL